MPTVLSFENPGTRSPRVVIVFTTTGEARSALTFARALSIPNTPIWLVCPITRSLVGYFRFERFLRFVTTLADEVDAGRLQKMRFLSAPRVDGELISHAVITTLILVDVLSSLEYA